MRDIFEFELLNRQEEFDIAAEICQGNEKAFDKLITSNLRLVVKIAHDFKSYGPIEDMISSGNLGLIRACEKFDPNKGAKFSSYAAWWIKQSMRRYITRNRTVRIPQVSMTQIIKINKAKSRLGRDASIQDLSSDTGIGEKTVQMLQTKGKPILSLNAPIGNDTTTTYENFMSSDDALPVDEIINIECKDKMRSLIEGLDDRERYIIIHRFGLHGGEPQILEEIANHFNKTRERIRQIQNIALGKLRTQIEEMK